MNGLKVGASKVCITPPPEMLPFPLPFGRGEYGKVYKDIYVRAAVIESGEKRVVFLAYELGGVGMTEETTRLIEQKYGIPPANVFFSATHNHDAPFAGETIIKVEGRGGELIRQNGIHVMNRCLEAVGEAISRLQPAKYGFGTGNSYINVNRDEPYEDGSWGQGRDFEGISDKTLAVIKFTDMNGRLIAAILNYAMHGTACYLGMDEKGETLMISGDVPGDVSRYVEERFNNEAVVLWTSGAGGNQNPIFFCGYTKYGHNGEKSFYSPGYAVWELCEHMGQVQGIDAIRIINGIMLLRDRMDITVVDKSVFLPGQKRPGRVSEGVSDAKIEDDDPVELKLKLMNFGDIALFGVNGELVCDIGVRLKAVAPLKNTVIVTHAREGVGYLPDKKGYDNRTFAFYGTRVKDGCVEDYITPAMLDMFEERHFID